MPAVNSTVTNLPPFPTAGNTNRYCCFVCIPHAVAFQTPPDNTLTVTCDRPELGWPEGGFNILDYFVMPDCNSSSRSLVSFNSSTRVTRAALVSVSVVDSSQGLTLCQNDPEVTVQFRVNSSQAGSVLLSAAGILGETSVQCSAPAEGKLSWK